MQSQVPESVGSPIVPPVVPAAVASAGVRAVVPPVPAVPPSVPPVSPVSPVPAPVSAVPAVRKRGRPTAAERHAREAQILATALDVFLHSGFGNSTIEELASAAKVTKRTVYAYFGDKSGLFAAMVRDLAVDVSLDAATDHGTLEGLAARIVYRVHSDELVGLHRLVIAESSRFPELARVLYSQGDARHITRLAEHIRDERGDAQAALAEPLFSLLLGERHRRRLLGMAAAPSPAQAAAHADDALAWLGLSQR